MPFGKEISLMGFLQHRLL